MYVGDGAFGDVEVSGTRMALGTSLWCNEHERGNDGGSGR